MIRGSKHLTALVLGVLLILGGLGSNGGDSPITAVVFLIGLLVVGITSVHWLVATKRARRARRAKRKKARSVK